MAASEKVAIVTSLLEHLEKHSGRLVFTFDPAPGRPREALVGYEFSREEPDNPENDMAGGAAYGVGATLHEALQQVAEQVKLDV